MIYVLDASAVIAYIRAEAGGDRVAAALYEDSAVCVVHALNWTEVYYDLSRSSGDAFADTVTFQLRGAGLRRIEDMSDWLCRAAARLKAGYRRVSLADCFGLALARDLSAPFLTADHHELDPLAESEEFRINFIR